MLCATHRAWSAAFVQCSERTGTASSGCGQRATSPSAKTCAGAGRREVRVADDAVLDDQPGAAEPLIVGHRADADDHRVRPQRRSVAQRDGQVAGLPADRPHADPEPGRQRRGGGAGRPGERPPAGPVARSIGIRHRVDDGHLAAGRARRRGGLRADEAAADHHDRAAFGEALLEREAVRQRAELVDAGLRPPRGRPRRRPRRDHEVVVGQQVAVGEQDLPGVGGERQGRRPEAQLDLVGRRGLRGEQGRALGRPRAAQHLLGQRRPVAGRPWLLADQGDGPAVPLGAQRPGRADAPHGRAHDDDPVPHGSSLPGLDGPSAAV